MKIVQAKCPNCGGTLKVDSEKEAAICEYCKTPFIVEKAINNYNTTIVNNNTFNDATVFINNDDKKRLSNYLDLSESAYLAQNYKDSFNYSLLVIQIDGKCSKAWDLKLKSGINLANLSINEVREAMINASKGLDNPDGYLEGIASFIIKEIAKKNLTSYVELLKKTNESLKSEYNKKLWEGVGPLFLNPSMEQQDNANVTYFCSYSIYIVNLVFIFEYQQIKKVDLVDELLIIFDNFLEIYKLLNERVHIYGRSLSTNATNSFKSTINELKKYLSLEKETLIAKNEKLKKETEEIKEKIETIKAEHPFDGGEYDNKIATLNGEHERLIREKKALGLFKFKEKSSIAKRIKETKHDIAAIDKEKQSSKALFDKENYKYYENESNQLNDLLNQISKNNERIKITTNRILKRI